MSSKFPDLVASLLFAGAAVSAMGLFFVFEFVTAHKISLIKEPLYFASFVVCVIGIPVCAFFGYAKWMGIMFWAPSRRKPVISTMTTRPTTATTSGRKFHDVVASALFAGAAVSAIGLYFVFEFITVHKISLIKEPLDFTAFVVCIIGIPVCGFFGYAKLTGMLFWASSKKGTIDEKQASLTQFAPVATTAQKTSRGFFGRKKTEALEELPPSSYVNMRGNMVEVPTLEEFEKNGGDITYPIKDPYQFVNLSEEEGEIIYHAIEPVLTQSEQNFLKQTRTAFDILINVNTVLVDVSDKLKFIDDTFKDIIDIYNFNLTDLEYKRILYYINRDYVGYGRADLMLGDRFIEDISCNGPGIPVYVYHRYYESIRTNIVFEELELNAFILRLAQLSGRHISILQPIRDAALPDGSRINLTLGKEVTKKGSTFTIRKFRSDPISPIEIIGFKTASPAIIAYLWILIEYGSSLLISGATAAGKTTLLNAASMLIRPENKIVSVEDTPEINLAHPNWIQAVTRIGFGESGSVSGVSGVSGISGMGGMRGKSAGDITLYDLLIAALRQRPEYIIVGEVRGEEAYTLFQAISVGHAAMGTIHAASMTELLARVESQPMNVPRVMIANLDLVIFLAALRKGDSKVRRIREIVEILGINPATKELITNVVFRLNPAKDEIEYVGRSFVIEKISKSFGIPKETLEDEVAKRNLLLQAMFEQGIVSYKDVTEMIRKYYLDKQEAIATARIHKSSAGLVIEKTAQPERRGVETQ